MANPIEQFEIKPLIPLEVGGIDLSFTNSSLWMLIAGLLSAGFMAVATRNFALVPGRVQAAAELFFDFVDGMIRDTMGPEGRHYFPLIFTLFLMVLMGNVLGLIPYSFTYTSHIAVTGALALFLFSMVIVIGVARHGLHFFSLFVPEGVPLLLMPLVILIEIISYLARPVTLSVRLFANMIAGHIMLKVFAGFSVGLLSLGAGGLFLGVLPMLFNAMMLGFETMIAGLQAYVFALLACIYLKDTLELEH